MCLALASNISDKELSLTTWFLSVTIWTNHLRPQFQRRYFGLQPFTSPPTSCKMTPVLLFLYLFLVFPFNFLPSPVHFTGFFVHIFIGFFAIFILLSSNNSLSLYELYIHDEIVQLILNLCREYVDSWNLSR